jgi:hypothetical protein
MPSLSAWVVSADMGMGHQRAAHALSHLAHEGVLVAGSPGITDADETRFWRRLTWSYEALSRARQMPLVGGALFGLLDSLLHIPPFYPLRDLSRPSINNYLVDRLIRQGLGRTLIAQIKSRSLPMITTFYAPALVADYAGCSPVYTTICDADLNRIWVAASAKRSGLQYFAPCGRAMRRLRQYGVPDERIFITGFPLPRSAIGGPGMEVLREDLLRRIARLDPRGRFCTTYGPSVEAMLGAAPECRDGTRVTLAFAVGGAGAQTEIGLALAQSLKPGILDGRFRLILLAGVNPVVAGIFEAFIGRIGLGESLGEGVQIVRADSKS